MTKNAIHSVECPRRSRLGWLLLVLLSGALGSDALLATPAPAAVNLIQDPGFETGPGTLTRTTSPWVGEETNVAHIVSDGHAHSGAQEAVFQPGSVANQGQLMQMFAVTPNTDYVASAWIGGTPGFSTVGQPANNDTTGKPTQRGFGIHIPHPGADPDGDGDTQGFDTSIIIKYVTITNNSSGSYQFYSFTFNSGANTQLFVDFDANLPANGVLRVDDVSVTLAPGSSSPPQITTQPANQTVSVGHTATFTVAASGTAPLSYQWQKNGANITGATSTSYTTPATTLTDNGATFQVVVTNSAGSTTSHAATLTVTSTAGAPAITTNPANQTVVVGNTATFSVTASGTAPLNYQWQKNGTNITGATSASYTTPATSLGDSGSTFRVIVSNSAGNVTSTSATLTVNSPGGGGTLPSPWQDIDIGPVGVAGSASDAGGTFTIHGAGADIGGTADSFNYLYQPLSGDGSITLHVASLGNTAPGAQVGVMIRESLSPDSPFADMLITPGGASFQGRIQPGSPNFNDGGPSVTPPYWLRITRTGDVFVGSTSTDGQTWTQAGTVTLPMPQNVFIGIAVTSHTTSAATTAMADSVSGTGGWQPAGTSGGSGSGGGGGGGSGSSAPSGGSSGSGGGGCGLTGLETLLFLTALRLLRLRRPREAVERAGNSPVGESRGMFLGR